MDIPYCVYLNKLDNPQWEALPDGYNITYQPTGAGRAYFAHNDHIEPSCRHFSRMVSSAFIAQEYETYGAARAAIIEHSKGCTKTYFPGSEVNIILLPPMSL